MLNLTEKPRNRSSMGRRRAFATAARTTPQRVGAFVCPIGSKAGLSLADGGAADLDAARASGAAYWLHITLFATFLDQAGNEYLAEAGGRVEWYDTADRKALATHAVPQIKDGAYDKDSAPLRALRAAGKSLAEDLALHRVRLRPRHATTKAGRAFEELDNDE